MENNETALPRWLFKHRQFVITSLALILCTFWQILRTIAIAATGLNAADLLLPCAGDMVTSKPAPANAKINSSTIKPVDFIADGDTLHATAKVECSPREGRPVLVYSDHGHYRYILLYDDGTHGDQHADDDIWETEMKWAQKYFADGESFAWVVLGFTKQRHWISGTRVTLHDKKQPKTTSSNNNHDDQ